MERCAAVGALAVLAVAAADMAGCRRAAMRDDIEPQALVSHEELNESESARFVRAAGLAVGAEIEAARLAARRAQGPPLRSTAEAMLADHTRMFDELGSIAREMGIPLPAAAPGDAGRLAVLASAPDGAFDAEFRREAGVSHRELESLLEEHAAAGPDPRLRAFAARWLAVERAHRAALEAAPAHGG
ncbi:MAG: DUF4142 domain-containing protein [Phycisphaerales bacterium]